MITHSYFDGLLYGLLFIFMLGPAFFTLLQTALKYGFVRAVLVSMGVVLVDMVFITLILFGFSNYLKMPELKFWLGLIGAVVLVVFGISSWIKKADFLQNPEIKPNRSLIRFFLKGILVNGFNPVIILFWIGIIGAVANLGYSFNQQMYFFGGFMTSVFALDIIKAFFLVRISNKISPKLIKYINRGVGVIFIFFGVRILLYLVYNI